MHVVRQQIIEFFSQSHHDVPTVLQLAKLVENLIQDAPIADRIDAFVRLIR